MSLIVIAPEKAKKEKQVALSALQPGMYFRFPSTPFEEIKQEDGAGQFYVIVGKITKEGEERVEVYTSDYKLKRSFDADRLVIRHDVQLLVSPAETVDE
jgi:hypothetical protein